MISEATIDKAVVRLLQVASEPAETLLRAAS
jgi:hypothetical protein